MMGCNTYFMDYLGKLSLNYPFYLVLSGRLLAVTDMVTSVVADDNSDSGQ